MNKYIISKALVFSTVAIICFLVSTDTHARISDFASPGNSLSMSDFSLFGENDLDQSGKSLASAGDVDGDGLDDLLIGAQYNDEAGTSAGKVYLVLGKTLLTGISSLSSADYMFTGENAGDNAGSVVASAGDVDADGLDDILIAASSNDDAGSSTGKVYLVLGKSLTPGTQSLSIADYAYTGVPTGPSTGSLLGRSLGSAGDIDGDGLDDIMMTTLRSLSSSTSSFYNVANAYIVLGKSLVSGTSSITTADYKIYDSTSFCGSYANHLGDIDGDGLSDIILSTYNNTSSGDQNYTLYIFLGKNLITGDIDVSAADYTYTQENADDSAGYGANTLASAGDVDGDGLDDILVGADENNDAGNYAGKVYLILASSLSSSTKSLATADYQFTGESDSQSAGRSVSSLGDIDGDGLSDILIGAPGNDDNGSRAGKAYVILSSSLTAGTTSLSDADYMFMGEGSDGYAGQVAVNAGDVNGDGTNDIFIGAYNYPGFYPVSDNGAGKSYIILGNENCTVHADAGSDQTVGEAETVTLNGSGSFTTCSSGPLTYTWSISYGPSVTLSDSAAVSPTFTSGVDGDIYVLTLTVETNGQPSDSDSIVVTVTNNTAPIANNVTIVTYDPMLIVTSDATDLDGDSFTNYYFHLDRKPRISSTRISPANYTTSPSTTIIMDTSGTYIISYKVYDGREWSNTATITIIKKSLLTLPDNRL
ncbi:MAG: hypothetical protein ABII18_04310 [bacterium]